jgi:hypothetical protein
MKLNYKGLDITENIIIEKYKELINTIPEFKYAYLNLTEDKILGCASYIIHDLEMKSEFPKFWRNSADHIVSKFYQLWAKGVFNFINGDNFDYVGEIEVDDPFACDFYNDNLENR